MTGRSLANDPEITRNYIANPGNIARQLLNGFAMFRQGHDKQISFDRSHKIGCREARRASDEARLNWNFSRPG
jgi:hypothetical protein